MSSACGRAACTCLSAAPLPPDANGNQNIINLAENIAAIRTEMGDDVADFDKRVNIRFGARGL